MGGGAGAAGFFGGMLGGIGSGLVERARRRDDLNRIALQGALARLTDIAHDPRLRDDASAVDDVNAAFFKVLASGTGHGEREKGKKGKEDPFAQAQMLVSGIMHKVYPSGEGRPEIPEQPPAGGQEGTPIGARLGGHAAMPGIAERKGLFYSQEEQEARSTRAEESKARSTAKGRVYEQQELSKLEEGERARRRKRGQELGLTGGTEAEFEETGKVPTERAPANLHDEHIKGPDGKVFLGNKDPRTGKLYDGAMNELDPTQYTPIDKEIDPRIYGLGGQEYWLQRSLGKSKEEAGAAGLRIVHAQLGTQLSSTQQLMVIREWGTGVPPGPGLPTAPGAVAPSAGAPTKPAAAAGGAERAAPTARPPSLPEVNLMSKYIAWASAGATGKMEAGEMRGMQLLSQRTGLSPMELQTHAAEFQALRTALKESVDREMAIDRLQKLVKFQGKLYTDTVKKLEDMGSPILNQAWRSVDYRTFGDTNVGNALFAINMLERQYGTLTAGGAQSRAMLHVDISERMEKLFMPGATVKMAMEQVSFIAQEAEAERKGYQDNQREVMSRAQANPLNKAFQTPTKQAAKAAAPAAATDPFASVPKPKVKGQRASNDVLKAYATAAGGDQAAAVKRMEADGWK